MDRIRLNCKKYLLFGTSERWKAFRKQAIADIRACWQRRGKYHEPFQGGDLLQLYDSWDRNDIYNGWCRFQVDAGDERFTVGAVFEPADGPGIPFDDFDELIGMWREKLGDPTIGLRTLEPAPGP